MTYVFKKKVLEAMIVSSPLNACETWLGIDSKEAEKLYVSAVLCKLFWVLEKRKEILKQECHQLVN